METYAVYLQPRSSLASDIGSDTLFGAVCWAFQVLQITDVEKMLGDFNPPRFAFSATFPVFHKNGAALCFYPRPMTDELLPAEVNSLAETLRQEKPSQFKDRPPSAATTEVVERYKKYLKKATYLSESLFREWVEHGLTTLDLYKRLKTRGAQPNDIRSSGGVLFRQDDLVRFFGREDPPLLSRQTAVQHNQIDRIAGSTGDGLLFFENETFFAPGAGLWCLVAVDGDETRRWLAAAFRYLSDTGLGASRSVGKGQFDIRIGEEIALPDAGASANSFVILSRYLPVDGEWAPNAEPLRYEIKTVWAKREQKFPRPLSDAKSSPVYKKPVRMFAPGSIFPIATAREPVCGRLAQVVEPDENGSTPVWQSGLAVRVFAKVEAGGAK